MAEGFNHSNPSWKHDREQRHKAHKNRKKWCKGKAGKAHKPEVQLPPNVPGWKKEYCKPAPNWAIAWGYRIFCDHAIMCTECGKHLGHPDTCPTWNEPTQVKPEDPFDVSN